MKVKLFVSNFLNLICMKKIILSLFLFMIIGCSQSDSVIIDEEKFIGILKSAPYAEIPKENLPHWLVETIDDYENSKEMVIYAFSPVTIHKGEWKNRTVYIVNDPLSSCVFCYIYYEDGKKIVLTDDEIYSLDFQNSSKNWVIIWKIGGTEIK